MLKVPKFFEDGGVPPLGGGMADRIHAPPILPCHFTGWVTMPNLVSRG